MTYAVVFLLVLFSGLFSGLTIGLISLNVQDLKRKVALGDAIAARVYEVRKDGNLLLTTLLVGNVAVNAVLSVFLSSITSGLVASLLATALIVIFGEIIPMAAFSRYSLLLGSKMIWVVKIFLFLMYPVAKPIALVLDAVLGEELMSVHSKQELIRLVEEHKLSTESDIDETEERIVRGALSFSERTVGEVMTPRSVLYSVDAERKITAPFIKELIEKNFSRVPVYQESNEQIVGVLYLRALVGSGTKNKQVSEIMEKKHYMVRDTDQLDCVLDMFIKHHHHLFIVRNEFEELVGIVTLEDILEEIVRVEIIDETDRHVDLRALARGKEKSK